MKKLDYEYVCKHLAKSTATTVRVFEDENMLCNASPWALSPDPATPYLSEILNPEVPFGVYTTPLFQIYTFFTVENRYRFVIGPSGLIVKDEAGIARLCLELGVAKEKQSEYTRLLQCAPTLTLDKSVSLLKLLVYIFNEKKPDTSEIFFNEKATPQYANVAKNKLENDIQKSYAEKTGEVVEQAYNMELMMWGMIRGGQAEKLRELQMFMPSIHIGEMAKTALRQVKNTSICAAAMAARAAIEGGLDCATAFEISDLFIQKVELLTDAHTMQLLQWDLIIDYATRVHAARHGLSQSSPLFTKCAKYVSSNLAHAIKVEEISRKLHISRAYLCTSFKKETGISLSQYIQQEKIEEAKRLLLHTNHTLLEISDYLAFSSQSHFQTAFKKITGKTPAQFKKEQ